MPQEIVCGQLAQCVERSLFKGAIWNNFTVLNHKMTICQQGLRKFYIGYFTILVVTPNLEKWAFVFGMTDLTSITKKELQYCYYAKNCIATPRYMLEDSWAKRHGLIKYITYTIIIFIIREAFSAQCHCHLHPFHFYPHHCHHQHNQPMSSFYSVTMGTTNCQDTECQKSQGSFF